MATETTSTYKLSVIAETGTSAEELGELLVLLKDLKVNVKDFYSTLSKGDGGKSFFSHDLKLEANNLRSLARAIGEVKYALHSQDMGIAKMLLSKEQILNMAEYRDLESKLRTGEEQTTQHITAQLAERGKATVSEFKKTSNALLNQEELLESESARVILNGETTRIGIIRSYANQRKAIMRSLALDLKELEEIIYKSEDPEKLVSFANAMRASLVADSMEKLRLAQAQAQATLAEQDKFKQALQSTSNLFKEYINDYRSQIDVEIAIAKHGEDTIRGIELKRAHDILTIRKNTDIAIKTLIANAQKEGPTADTTALTNEMNRVTLSAEKAEKAIQSETQARLEAIKTEKEIYDKKKEWITQYLRYNEKAVELSLAHEQAVMLGGNDSLKALQTKYQQDLLAITREYEAKRDEVNQQYLENKIARESTVQRKLNALMEERSARAIEAYAPIKRYKDEEAAIAALLRKQKEANKEAVASIQMANKIELSVYRTGLESKETKLLMFAEREKEIYKSLAAALASIDDKIKNKTITTLEEATQARNAIIGNYKAQLTNLQRAIASVEPNPEKVNAYNMNLAQSIAHYTKVYAIMGSIYTISNKIQEVLREIPKEGIELESTFASLEATMGSATESAMQFLKIDKEAKRTGIAVNTLRENFRNFAASSTMAGESVETTWEIFKNINTVMTTLHASGDKTAHVFLAIAQMFNKGKIQSEELVKQLSNYLPGAFSSFAAATGRTTMQLAEEMKKGNVYAHKELDAFSRFMAERFGGSAFEAAREGLNAAIGDYQTAVTKLEDNVYRTFEQTLKTLLRGVTSYVDALTEASADTYKFSESIGAVRGALEGLLGIAAVQTLISLLPKVLNPAGLAITTFGASLGYLNVQLDKGAVVTDVLLHKLSELQKIPEEEAALKRIDLLKRQKDVTEAFTQAQKSLQDYTKSAEPMLSNENAAAKGRVDEFIKKLNEQKGQIVVLGETITRESLAIPENADPRVVYHTYFEKIKSVVEAELTRVNKAVADYKPTAPGENTALFEAFKMSEKDVSSFEKGLRKQFEKYQQVHREQLKEFIAAREADIEALKTKASPAIGEISPQEALQKTLELQQQIAEASRKSKEEEIEYAKQLHQTFIEVGSTIKKDITLLSDELPNAIKLAESSLKTADYRTLTKAQRGNLVNADSTAIGPMQTTRAAYLEGMGVNDNNRKALEERFNNAYKIIHEIATQAKNELNQVQVDALQETEKAGQAYLNQQIENFGRIKLALLAYKEGPSSVRAWLTSINKTAAEVTEDEINARLKTLGGAAEAYVNKVLSSAVKSSTMTKEQKEELVLSSELLKLDSERAEIQSKTAKDIALAQRTYAALTQEFEKQAKSTAATVGAAIDALLGKPTKTYNDYLAKAVDLDRAIAFYETQKTSEATKQVELLKQQKTLYEALASAKDKELATQKALENSRSLAGHRGSIVQAQMGAGLIGEWEGASRQTEINKQLMADTQAALDAWKKQKETLTGAGQPVPESLTKNIEEAQWQLQELGITGDVVANKIRTTLQGAFANSFKDFISGAKSASEAMQSFAMTILDSAMQIMANKIAMMFLSKVAGIPGLSFLGGAEAAVPSAKGNVISDGKVKPFAKGGIVTSPTLFPLRNATGLMGEAGPEAIIPLQRGKDGKLGVASGQGTSYNTVNNISVTIEKYTGKDDPETTAAKIAEAISRKIAKEEIASASRKGGRLAPVGAF